MDWKQKENRAHAKGRRGPSCAKQRYVNETRTNPTTDNPPDPLNQGLPLPHRPRTTSKPLSPPIVEARQTYLHCLFQFHSIRRLCLLQRTFLAPQVLSKPWSMAIAEKLLLLIVRSPVATPPWRKWWAHPNSGAWHWIRAIVHGWTLYHCIQSIWSKV
jgi:hypothetical protein